MENPKLELAKKLKEANNVLVTVSRDPSVDQLSALIGLTLILNKLSKHAAAIFSGQVPSTIEFLKPEQTIEKNTDSLRDFIIAIDKSKADKLRYKVEDNIVRIFITPFRTSISQADLEFSQGDFNVDIVVALGVLNQNDLDETITSHGRILHDATVACINLDEKAELGSLNWNDPNASSLSELVTELGLELGKDLIDAQIATALLTGIVAETARFSNEKTSSSTMTTSSVLMAAGADQQLVATKLEEPAPATIDTNGSFDPDNDSASQDGSLSIAHDELPEPSTADEPPQNVEDASSETDPSHVSDGPSIVTEPPSLGGELTANSQPEGLDPSSDPLSLVQDKETQKLLTHNDSADDSVPQPTPPTEDPIVVEPPPVEPTPPTEDPIAVEPPPTEPTELTPPTEDPIAVEPPPVEPTPNQTLADLETSVHSSHVDQEATDSMAYDPAKFGITFEPNKPAEDTQPPAGSPPPVPPPIPFQFGNQQKQ